METKKLFGNTVVPDCAICSNNRGTESRIQCQILNNNRDSGRNRITAETCSAYAYDPLKRKPKTAPDFRTFSEDDFKL